MKRIVIAAFLLSCISCQADPSTLPDVPAKKDHIVILAKTDDKMVGVDVTNMRYDKEHNILDFLEVIIDEKAKQIIASKLAFACWDHKASNPTISVMNMQNGQIIQQEKLDGKWSPISADTWLDTEYKAVCPKVKDPRSTEL